ncbi:hypothetical protein HID58_071282, partial [Brassica napus]
NSSPFLFPPSTFPPIASVNPKTPTRRRNMEPHRSVAGRPQRKPLGDCTNTISRTPQHPSSSSSSVKFANPSLTSSLKRLVDQTSLKEKAQDANNSSKVVPGTGTGTVSKSVRPVTRRASADLGSPAATTSSPPSKPDDFSKPDARAASRLRPVTRRMSADLGFPASAPPRPRSGVGDKDFTEPYSVYTVRRKASGRKRSKDVSSSSAMPRLRLDLLTSPGQRTVKKHKEDNVDQDYIEQQKAYFAEVDAFELQEEEVSSSDLD